MKIHWKRALCAALAASLCAGAAGEEAALDGARLRQVKQALYALGYHSASGGAAVMDDDTRAALRSFQLANGLEPTGEPDADTLKLLDEGSGVTCHEYLVALAQSYAELPILQRSSSGDSVVWLQKALKELGYFAGACDGVFGDATEAAVRRFQRVNGLSETGVADPSVQMRLNEGQPITWEDFLDRACAETGDSGVDVRAVQRRLRELGYYSGADSGEYGDLTADAVSRFQGDHDLEATGSVDRMTAQRLYSDQEQGAQGALNQGDVGDAVTELQSKLAALGYFDSNTTGIYGATTETAVRLFQMANGLPSTGEVDLETMMALNGGAAVPLQAVRESFLEQVRNQQDSARSVICGVAKAARGHSFETGAEDLFRGFAFVQYVCVAAGIPVVSPEELIELIDDPVGDESLEEGEILAFRMEDADGPWLMLAVSTGADRVTYSPPESGFVLESSIRSMYGAEVRRWKMGTVEE